MSTNHEVQWPGWKVVGRIGIGSFGTVYEIQRDVFGRIEKSALKVIFIPEKPDEIEELYSEGYDQESITLHFRDYLEDIVKEYSLMLDMKGHTNVVYCDDLRYIQHEDGIGWTIYIKMELLTPLQKALHGQYSEEQTIRVGIDICNALELCKTMNIVHRDIKPQNIFMSRTRDYKLGDFGVAKVSDKTASGTKIGTYEYMAPEVFLGQPYGAASDMYSLGLVLYWMMNEKRTPFLPLPPQIPSASAKETARNRRFHGEALPRPVNGSEELWQIVQKACAFSSVDRYASAQEMRVALCALLADIPAAVTPELEISTPVENDDDRTISVFHDTIPKQEPAPELEPEATPMPEAASVEETEPAPTDEEEDERTMSVFHDTLPKQESVPLPEETPTEKAEHAQVEVSAEPPQESTSEPEPPVPQKKTRKKRVTVFASIGIAAVAALIIGYFTFCTWAASTCEKEGHQWLEATCMNPRTCSVCLATQGVSLDHTWTFGNLVSFDAIFVESSDSDKDKATAKMRIDRILDSFLSGNATQETFERLGRQCDLDTLDAQYFEYRTAPIEHIVFRSWFFELSRAEGDVGIIEIQGGYCLVYYIGSSTGMYCDICGEVYS